MEHNRFDDLLALVAQAYDSTPEEIRRKILLALREGQQSPDPQIRALWASVPHSRRTDTCGFCAVSGADTAAAF